MIRHRFALLLLLLLTGLRSYGQELYVKTYGKPGASALIFLHGGPGYNSATFEATTPQRLADSGFFVVIYDRRGEGRSRDTGAKFTLAESSRDLLTIYDRFQLKQATLLGHSFGGMVGTRFAAAHPEKVRALVLISAPLSLPASFRNIIARCRSIYEAKGDSMNLKYIATLETMDTASLMYSTYCFGHAMQNGFYAPKTRSEEAKRIYAGFREDTALFRQAMQMDYKAPKGYWKHERYTTLDLRPQIAALRKRGLRIHGIYGQEDGLYAPEQIAELGALIGKTNVMYPEACSHNVFIDQQTLFVQALNAWAR